MPYLAATAIPYLGASEGLSLQNHCAIVHFAKNCSNVHMNGANFQEGKLA